MWTRSDWRTSSGKVFQFFGAEIRSQRKGCDVELLIFECRESAWTYGLWRCSKSMRYFGWTVCKALKVSGVTSYPYGLFSARGDGLTVSIAGEIFYVNAARSSYTLVSGSLSDVGTGRLFHKMELREGLAEVAVQAYWTCWTASNPRTIHTYTERD